MKAILSPCGQYRYLLQRGEGPTCSISLLNPSTADHTKDDATSRKLNRFVRDWGYSAYDLTNVGAGRATDPKDWRAMQDPVGPDNDFYLELAAFKPLIVVGWGNEAPPDLVRRAVAVLTRNGQRLYCLGTNANGSPKHPLYVPYDTPLKEWIYT